MTGHESCTRVVESCRSKPAISKSLPIRRRRKKENIMTYHRQVTIGVMTRTVSRLTSVKKRRNRKRGSNEQKQGNRKEKKDSRQLSCNSHCSFDQAMRSSGNTHANSRLPTFIDSHPRLIQLHKFTIQVTAENTSKYVHLCYNLFGASAICNSLIGEHAFSRAMYVQE